MAPSVFILMIVGDVIGGISAWPKEDMIVPLLLVVLGLALGVGLICLLFVVHYVRTDQSRTKAACRGRHLGSRSRRSFPSQLRIFSPPDRWMAIRSDNLHLVQSVLGLRRPTPCTWEEGLTVAHEHQLFISSPLKGWVLVLGPSLPEPADDVDHCYRFVLHLSKRLGQVQFFSVNRALNHHAWVLADEGAVSRAYAWAEKTLWNQGRMTRDEIELDLRCYEYGESPEREDFWAAAPTSLNTDKVPMLAARWSIDPSSLNGRFLKQAQGIAGSPSRSIAY
jgi:hypothetical protein